MLNSRSISHLDGEISVVQDNKVVCTAKGYTGMGDSWVSVVFDENNTMAEKIKETQYYKDNKESLEKITWKHFPFRFDPLLGTFISCGFTDTHELEELFKDVRIVNAFNLRWGMVPDTFCEVEGYRSFENE